MTPRTAATTLALSLAMTFAFTLHARGQSLDWIEQYGTDKGFDLYDRAGGVAPDGWGSVYVVGSSKEGVPPVEAVPGEEAFIIKYDEVGEIQWKQTIGLPGYQDQYTGVATDAFGNAIVAGTTRADLVEPNQGFTDLLLAKYDPDGNRIWTRQFGSESGDFVRDIATDDLGNLFVAGRTGGRDVGLGGPVDRVDAYVAKFDDAGDLRWVRQFGGFGSDEGLGIAIDTNGNIFIAGQNEIENDDDDGFLRKYDTNGSLLWNRAIATNEFDRASAVAVASNGNVFVSGYTYGDLDGPLQGEGPDWFLRSYDTDGTVRWTRQIGSDAPEGSFDVTTDEHGRVYVVGGSQGDLRGPNAGEADPVVIAFDETGTELWSWHGGTAGFDRFESAATDGLGHLYGFGPIPGIAENSTDVFLAKFTLDPPQPGDTDGDGDVDVDDLNAVRNNFGTTGADDGSLAGDARPFDGMVDIDDLNAVRNNFGAGSTAVAEPSSMLLALAALASGWTPRRRRRRG